MPQPRVLILRAPGTNCDQETAFAFERAGAKAEVLHVNRLLEDPSLCGRFQIFCIPGGFAYGDDVAAGRILGNQIQYHLADRMAEFKAAGKLMLGICNGFQALIKSGVLLEPDAELGPPATLTYNDSGRYEDRWVRLDVQGSKSVFLAGIDSMYLPVAHAEGKFVARDAEALGQLEANDQLVLRYLAQRRGAGAAAGSQAAFPAMCREHHVQGEGTGEVIPAGGDSSRRFVPGGSGRRLETPPTSISPSYSIPGRLLQESSSGTPVATPRVPYPDNPNGSIADVAGVCDATGRALGLMPHPERHIDPTQHPRWTRGEAGPVGDGLQVFLNAVAYFA